MLTVEKLKAMKPWEIFAKWEAIDDWQIIRIWCEWHRVQRVAVRWKGYHDRAIYYHIIREDYFDPEFPDYGFEWTDQRIADIWDKLTNDAVINLLVECEPEAFNLYRY